MASSTDGFEFTHVSITSRAVSRWWVALQPAAMKRNWESRRESLCLDVNFDLKVITEPASNAAVTGGGGRALANVGTDADVGDGDGGSEIHVLLDVPRRAFNLGHDIHSSEGPNSGAPLAESEEYGHRLHHHSGELLELAAREPSEPIKWFRQGYLSSNSETCSDHTKTDGGSEHGGTMHVAPRLGHQTALAPGAPVRLHATGQSARILRRSRRRKLPGPAKTRHSQDDLIPNQNLPSGLVLQPQLHDANNRLVAAVLLVLQKPTPSQLQVERS